jgi:hypothetical protein
MAVICQSNSQGRFIHLRTVSVVLLSFGTKLYIVSNAMWKKEFFKPF